MPPPESQDYKGCLKSAYRHLARREHSRRELARKLALRFDNATVDAVIDELLARRLLDEQRFAEAYINDLLRRSPCGLRLIRAKLSERGLDEGDIDEALRRAALDEDELLQSAARDKLAGLTSLPRQTAARRLLSHLYRRGFPTGPAQSITLELLEDWSD